MSGLAIDIGRARDVKSHLQDALDATVLALAAAPQSMDGSSVFAANYRRSALKSKYETVPSVTFETQKDGTVSASASMMLKPIFLKLLALPDFQINVRASALAGDKSANKRTLEILQAQGWFAKDFYAVEKDEYGNIVTETKILSYDYDHATDTATWDPPLTEATVILDQSSTKTVLKMRVWPAYLEHTSRDQVPYLDYYSDAQDARTKHDGDCTSPNGEATHWEDAPNNDSPENDDYNDFVYTIKCENGEAKFAGSRLVQ